MRHIRNPRTPICAILGRHTKPRAFRRNQSHSAGKSRKKRMSAWRWRMASVRRWPSNTGLGTAQITNHGTNPRLGSDNFLRRVCHYELYVCALPPGGGPLPMPALVLAHFGGRMQSSWQTQPSHEIIARQDCCYSVSLAPA